VKLKTNDRVRCKFNVLSYSGTTITPSDVLIVYNPQVPKVRITGSLPRHDKSPFFAYCRTEDKRTEVGLNYCNIQKVE